MLSANSDCADAGDRFLNVWMRLWAAKMVGILACVGNQASASAMRLALVSFAIALVVVHCWAKVPPFIAMW